MKGRYIHEVGSVTGSRPAFQAYGQGDESINSISRALINRLLLDELDRHSNLKVMFEVKVARVESDARVVYRTPDGKEFTIQAKFVVGADGAFSVVRSSLLRYDRVDYALKYVPHGYKELTIPASPSGDFALPDWQGLHIWPRSEFMLIALPNPDKTFTATLFAPFDGPHGLNTLKTAEQIKQHFQR
jgi:kynurenine 3-monooxygenase